ncbi:50S ribosomal protein L20 [Bienertia sinuspersici]
MNCVPELPITYNNEMASCKNGSVARRSNQDKLSKNYYGNRISTYSVSCSSSCSEDDGCLDDWEYQGGSRAWSPDDVYRPRSLPSVSKQQYKQNQLNLEHSAATTFCLSIYCEDFDVTDSSFEPCPCCRKHYDSMETNGDLPVRTTHSCSKNTLV